MKDALKMSGTKSTENGYTGDATTKSSIICVRFEFTELIHLQLSRLFFPVHSIGISSCTAKASLESYAYRL